MPRLDAAAVNELHARVCKALADAKRLLIINELRGGPRPVGDVSAALGLAQPTVSRHLAVLKDRGFVASERSGSRVRYSLASPKIVQAMDLLRQFMIDDLGWRPDPAPAEPGGIAAPPAAAAEVYALHARVCHAIADGRRLLIINELRDGAATVSEIMASVGGSQANVSQHLAVLREHGMVAAHRSGIHVHYSLTSQKIVEAVDLLYSFMVERYGGALTSRAG